MGGQQHRNDFQKILEHGSRELFEDNPDKMESAQLLPTPNEIAEEDLRLFFIGLQNGTIELKRGARFNTLDRPKDNGRWGLLSRSRKGGWYNAEYLPQIAAYVLAINELGYQQERTFFELPDKALKLDLAILDDANEVLVLGEAKRRLNMLDPLINEVLQKYGERNPGSEGRNEARQLAWRLWTTRAPFLWLIGPGARRAYEVRYNPLSIKNISVLLSAKELKLDTLPAVRLVIPQIKWQWQEDFVDPALEHIEIRYGDASQSEYSGWLPIALIGKPKGGVFPVRWLMQGKDAENDHAIQETCKQLNFYLVEKGERDPWEYAKYHCNTCANMYSKVHWGYFPYGQDKERQSSCVVKLSAKDAEIIFRKTLKTET